MPSGDSIAASRPVLPVHDHRLFRYAGSLFRYPEHLSGIGFRQTHNVRTTANDGFRSLTPHSESSAFTRTMVSISDKADVAARGKPCGGRCLFHECYGVFEVKHQGISRVDEGVLTIAALAPGTNNILRRVRVFVVAAKRKSLAILPWQSRDTVARASRASSRARKMQSSAPLHRHSAVRRARCSGRERPEWCANCIAKLFLNAAVDLQVDIRVSSGAMRIITSPDSRVPATRAGLFSFFTCFSCGGLLTSCASWRECSSRFCK